MKQILERSLFTAAFLCIAALSGCAATAPKSAAPAIPHEDTMVKVRGNELHFRIYPGRRDTVLLESGFGYGAAEWDDVAPRLRAATGATIITYDRPGLGKSDLPDVPYDLHEEVTGLHAGLLALGRNRDLILVGHSYGGYLIQLYANFHPADVRGLVYVDSNTVTGIDALDAAKVADSVIRRNDVPDPTKEQRANLRAGKGYASAHEAMRRYPVICGVPVVVITAGKTPQGLADPAIDGWRRGHAELAAQSDGVRMIAQESGHMVPLDEPYIIVEAVRTILKSARSDSAWLGTPGKPCSAR